MAILDFRAKCEKIRLENLPFLLNRHVLSKKLEDMHILKEASDLFEEILLCP